MGTTIPDAKLSVTPAATEAVKPATTKAVEPKAVEPKAATTKADKQPKAKKGYRVLENGVKTIVTKIDRKKHRHLSGREFTAAEA